SPPPTRRRGTSASPRARRAALTSPSNLAVPPAADPLDRGDPEYVRALVLHDAGREEAAIARLKALVLARPLALWRYTLADWMKRRGRTQMAHVYLGMARDI